MYKQKADELVGGQQGFGYIPPGNCSSKPRFAPTAELRSFERRLIQNVAAKAHLSVVWYPVRVHSDDFG
ncbi:MAG: hypothetical protein Fur0035_01150 [Anaerolineales bacterium]